MADYISVRDTSMILPPEQILSIKKYILSSPLGVGTDVTPGVGGEKVGGAVSPGRKVGGTRVVALGVVE